MDYDEAAGTATLTGEPKPVEMTTVYAKAVVAFNDETVKAFAKSLGAEYYGAEEAPVKAKDTIHCKETGSEISETAPSEFQWMPGGIHTIKASFNGRPIELTVDCCEETTGIVQASLDEWREQYPKQKPFACIEHREEEAAFWPEGFAWKDDPEPGVYCKGEWSELGSKNVKGRIHRSFSPSFTTNAEYHKAKEKNGCMVFPAYAKGSKENPASITGVAFSVGSLTNVPAFKSILPVRARQAEPQPETNNNAEQKKGLRMKVVFIEARDGHAAGATVELADDVAVKAVSAGYAITEREHLAIKARDGELATLREKQKQQSLGKIDAAVARAVTRKALFPKGDGEKSAETIKAKHIKQLESGNDVDLIVELIDHIPGEVDAKLERRVTQSAVNAKDFGVGFTSLSRGDETLEETGEHYVKARENMTTMIRSGNWKDAIIASRESAVAMKKIEARSDREDFMLRDVVKAADFTDPDSQVGTLATGLVLLRNLGFLVNKLSFLPFISTDLSAEPARYGQPIFTRYITPPDVLTFVPGTGFTSDATTISNASAGTTQSGATTVSGTVTKSVPSTTDKTVTMNMFKGVEVEFGINKLASTARNLFGEQRGAQLYSLAENIHQHFLATTFAATWSGTKTSYVKALVDWNLKSFIGVKNSMTISKIPDMGRFILLHSFLYDKTLEDSNLLNAQAILSLINRDGSSFDATDLPRLFGIKPLESQLAAANNAGALTTWTDDTNPGSTNIVGFAGNTSSMLFVSRPPQDYTMTAQQLGVPITAAVELVTEPNSGLTVLVFKYADNGKMSISQRVCLMWGDAQGDPRQGFPIKLS
jgi:hypothetical protein